MTATAHPDGLPHYRGAGSDTRPEFGRWRQLADDVVATAMVVLLMVFLAPVFPVLFLYDLARGKVHMRRFLSK